MRVSHARMTMHATEHVAPRLDGQHVVHKIVMTVQARGLHDVAIALLYLNGIFEITGRKRKGVEESIVSLGQIFGGDTVMRRVAVVANGHSVVA